MDTCQIKLGFDRLTPKDAGKVTCYAPFIGFHPLRLYIKSRSHNCVKRHFHCITGNKKWLENLTITEYIKGVQARG